MEKRQSQRIAGLIILLAWFQYITFVFLTGWKDYGLTPQPEAYLKWAITRVSIVTLWFVVAALFLRFRKHPPNWRSFLYAFATTGIIAILLADRLIPGNVNYLAVAGTILIYALVSGFLCIAIRKPIIAAVLSPPLFAVQVFVDATAHLLSGVFRLH